VHHLAVSDAAASGLRSLPETDRSFAAAQAAWRFFDNEATSLPVLAEPLLAYAREVVGTACARYVLVAQDWSDIGYCKHTSKADRIAVTHKKDLGYDLHTALLLSDTTGDPLVPAYVGLRAADGVHSTRRERPLPPRAHLSEAGRVMRYVDRLGLARPAVHIIDQEADSVLHLRRWQRCKLTVLVRCDAIRLVLWQGREVLVSAIVSELAPEFRHVGEVSIRHQTAQQFVAETQVALHRPAKGWRTNKDGRKRRVTIKGKTIRMRLVVSQIRDAEGALLAEWLLWTNLPAEVAAETVATWYYRRWRIESYFKLVKSAGHHMENWQQESAAAVAKRLLVVSHACAIVWQLARSTAPEADAVRQLLVRLSGRLMNRKRPFTEPALLAGFFALLTILDTLERYSIDELKRLAAFALPTFTPIPDG
jgi:hypothetical protein